MERSSGEEPQKLREHPHRVASACCDRGSAFRLQCFLNDGGSLINPKSSKTGLFFFMILVVYLGAMSFFSIR